MKILSKTDTLIHYSINSNFFDNNSQLSKSHYTKNNWRNISSSRYVLLYEILFSIKDEVTGEYFIKYHKRLDMECVFDNLDKDVEEILRMKAEMNISMYYFLQQNTLSFFHLLNFEPDTFTDIKKENEIITTQEFLLNRELKSIKAAFRIVN